MKSIMIGTLLPVLVLLTFLSCADRAVPSDSTAPSPQSESAPAPSGEAAAESEAEGQAAPGEPAAALSGPDTAEIMRRYILPYENHCCGQNWDFSDPVFSIAYDPDDIFARQFTIDGPVSGFAMNVLASELPEQTRREYFADEDPYSVTYHLTDSLRDAVGRFYFGISALGLGDSLYGLDKTPPKNTPEISLAEAVTLANGDVSVTIDRSLDGRPLLSCVYVMRPFTVEEVPAALTGVFEPGDRAYRFLRVEDLPFAAEERAVEISTPDDLRALAETVNSGDPSYLRTTYLLMNDIDMTGEDFDPIGQFVEAEFHDPNLSGFNAVFDGQGYAISGLTIRQLLTDPEQPCYTGFFSLIGRYGLVRRLRLTDCEVSYTADQEALGGAATGGLAGMNYGNVADSHFSGTVTGDSQVGGLLGASGWRSAVENCTADAAVTGETDVGALAGMLHNAIVTGCEVSGEVTAVSRPGGYDRPRGIGGFAGVHGDGLRSGLHIPHPCEDGGFL